MSADARTSKRWSLYGSANCNYHSYRKVAERRRARRADRKQWQKDFTDFDYLDHDYCEGCGECGPAHEQCLWEAAWWPLDGIEAESHLEKNFYLRPEERTWWADKWLRSWRPKIVTMLQFGAPRRADKKGRYVYGNY